MNDEPILQCMGGWCAVRGRCAHYWAPKIEGLPPEERLCPPGRDVPIPLVPAELLEAA